MMESTQPLADEAARQELAAHPTHIPTHPDEMKNIPPQNIIQIVHHLQYNIHLIL